jgi:hypothetical protein
LARLARRASQAFKGCPDHRDFKDSRGFKACKATPVLDLPDRQGQLVQQGLLDKMVRRVLLVRSAFQAPSVRSGPSAQLGLLGRVGRVEDWGLPDRSDPQDRRGRRE